jgi:hypothetical protein
MILLETPQDPSPVASSADYFPAIKKDKREKARENKHLKIFNIFTIINKT